MSKEKLAVTIWNYKGGVGKSTISLILSQIAAQNNLKVLAIDLDEQKNLAETLKLSQSLFNSIEVRTELKDDFADEDFNFYVIDTHPSKDETITKALKFADIVLVPVLGGWLANTSPREELMTQLPAEMNANARTCMHN